MAGPAWKRQRADYDAVLAGGVGVVTSVQDDVQPCLVAEQAAGLAGNHALAARSLC